MEQIQMTPQTELALNNLFDGKEIRVLEHDHDIWFPLTDIASAWGIDRSTPDKIIERNEDVFFGLSNTVLDAASTPLKCLNERGLYLLMGKISAAHLKNVEAKKTIIRFQRWFPELVQKYRKKEIVQTTLVLQTPIDIINERLDIADIAVKRSGVPKEIAHAMAWATGDVKEISLSIAGYIKAQSTVQLQLPEAMQADKIEYDRLFSITKVASALKLPIDKVRNVLDSLNIIYFENGIWKLTAHGEQYGKMFMVTPGWPYRTNQKCYIKYNPLLIDLLKKYFDIQLPVAKVE
jgi:prophage antirepressor-like protein